MLQWEQIKEESTDTELTIHDPYHRAIVRSYNKYINSCFNYQSPTEAILSTDS